MKNLLILLSALSILAGCRSIERMLDQGDYDTVIEKAVKKLTGKPKKEEYVLALEQAFAKATRRDMSRIEALRQEGRASSWEEILHIAQAIDYRQDRIEPLLPLRSESGHKAEFTFVRTDPIMAEARNRAETIYVGKLEELTADARRGNKQAAREGWRLVDQIRYLNPDNDQRMLREELRELGTVHILLTLDNESRSILPPGLSRELLASDLNRSADDWERFYTVEDPDRAYDVLAELRVTNVDVSPERWRESSQEYTRSIKDGWEYVLDARGNVAKDSLGNDIKKDKFITVKATVVETFQEKAALVRARVEITDSATGKVLSSKPIEFEERFQHIARNFYGDERALETHLCERILPVGYPADTDMITAALFGLKPMFLQQVRNTRYL